MNWLSLPIIFRVKLLEKIDNFLFYFLGLPSTTLPFLFQNFQSCFYILPVSHIVIFFCVANFLVIMYVSLFLGFQFYFIFCFLTLYPPANLLKSSCMCPFFSVCSFILFLFVSWQFIRLYNFDLLFFFLWKHNTKKKR